VAVIELAGTDAGQVRSAGSGDTVLVRLAETPASGYRWEIDGYEPAVLVPSGSEFRPPTGTGMGGRGTRELRFAVVGPGRSLLRLALRRYWEEPLTSAERFEVTLVVT